MLVYLRIWLDEKLTFNLHIDNLVARSRQKISFLFRNRCNFPIFCRKWIIKAVVLSALDYWDVVYRHASATSLKALDAAYHPALRFITEEATIPNIVLYMKKLDGFLYPQGVICISFYLFIKHYYGNFLPISHHWLTAIKARTRHGLAGCH